MFWKGADGKVYVKGDQGVNAAGNWDNNSEKYWSGRGFEFSSIDPVSGKMNSSIPKTSPSTLTPIAEWGSTPIGGGGGGSSYGPSAAELRAQQEDQIRKDQARASIGATERNLAALDNSLNNQYGTIDSEYRGLLGRYDSEIGRHRGKYNEQTSSNEGTRDRNRHIGLVSSAQGGRGLASTLGSIGAYDESGSKLAGRAVARVANQDIGEADRTFETNAKQLNTAWSDLEEDDRLRRNEASTARNSQRENALYEAETQRAKLYQDIAGYHATLGDAGAASHYTTHAGNVNAAAVERPRSPAQPFQARNVQYDAGQLANYLAGQNDMSVATAGGAAGGSGPQLFANTRRRDREEEIY